MKKKIGDKPLMCMEFWVGWFDNWGVETHQTGDLEEHAKDLDEILSEGHVNIYMFEGGTNFGFTNGSNYYDELTPDVTSYDYDALLTEDGQITAKYTAFQNVIRKYTEIPEVKLSTEIRRKSYGKLRVKRSTSLFGNKDRISKAMESVYPVSMEKLDQGYGYILYESQLKDEGPLETLRLWGANDRANIFVDEIPTVTLYDRELLDEIKWEENKPEGQKLLF